MSASAMNDPTTATATPIPAPPLRYGPPIDLATAKQIMATAEAFAAARDWPMAIAIVDGAGQLVMLHKCDNTQYGSIDIAIAKAATAARFRRATKTFEDALAAGGRGTRVLTLDVCALEGGVPLLLDGAVIGAIGVSGMQASQDGEVAAAGAASIA
jgi:glc operon protein GlcG